MEPSKKPDFSGWATKAGLECSDGRTIMPGAFEHQDNAQVPLVWSHTHNDPELVLGHAILENRDEGVYAYCYLNKSTKAKAAREMIEHGDVNSLSIYANQLVEKGKKVFHGAIRELSLVLAGANPGARIENVSLSHGDGSFTDLDDEVVIFSGLALEHSDLSSEEESVVEDANAEEVEEDDEAVVEHALTSGATVGQVYETLTDDQKELFHFAVTEALAAGAETSDVKHSAVESDDSSTEQDNKTDDDKSEDNNEGDLTHQEGTDMTNVFEQNALADSPKRPRLSHDQISTILSDAKKSGSLKESFLAHADEYGITDLELLFPDAKVIQATPDFLARRMGWVAKVLDGTKHVPFSKIKTVLADITAEEARAKGYVKGTRKVEEVFGLLKRVTGPTTIYKKQKLDRDDIVDITDLDIVAFLKAEMRLMIEEEVARAVLVGDGRSNASPDKVKDPAGSVDGTGIRSILFDDDLYTIKKEMAANTAPKDAVKELVRARTKYRGSGKPTLFISDAELTEIMLEEDKFGRPLYETEQALADRLRVESIVTVDLFDEYDNLFAIMVNLVDYAIGSTSGGQLTSFEDFDIDFNQEKYLTETRLSGALTKPYSAVVVRRAQGTKATADAPSFDGATNTITIPTTEGVNYLINDDVVTGDVVIDGPTEVEAEPKTGYYLGTGTTRSWTYTV